MTAPQQRTADTAAAAANVRGPASHVVVDVVAGIAEEADRSQVLGLEETAGVGDDDEVAMPFLVVLPNDVVSRVDVDPGERALALVEEHLPHHVDLAHRVGRVRERLLREDVVRPEDG